MFYSNFHCWLCYRKLSSKQGNICFSCQCLITNKPVSCPRCGLSAYSNKHICGRCLSSPPPWQNLIAAGIYDKPLANLVRLFKSHRRYALASSLAKMILLAWLDVYRDLQVCKPDLIVPVPLTHYKHWKRGFNQSEYLGRFLAYWLNCKLDSQSVICLKNQQEQKTLTAQQRRKNLSGAFICNQSMQGRNIAVVDDVVTTGSTVTEISHCLTQQGAKAIQVWCLCRVL